MAESEPARRPNLEIIEGGKSKGFTGPDNSHVIYFPRRDSPEARGEWLIGIMEEMRERQEALGATKNNKQRRGPPFKNPLDEQIAKLLKEL